MGYVTTVSLWSAWGAWAPAQTRLKLRRTILDPEAVQIGPVGPPKDLIGDTHTHTHTHIYIYIYIICFVCVFCFITKHVL